LGPFHLIVQVLKRQINRWASAAREKGPTGTTETVCQACPKRGFCNLVPIMVAPPRRKKKAIQPRFFFVADLKTGRRTTPLGHADQYMIGEKRPSSGSKKGRCRRPCLATWSIAGHPPKSSAVGPSVCPTRCPDAGGSPCEGKRARPLTSDQAGLGRFRRKCHDEIEADLEATSVRAARGRCSSGRRIGGPRRPAGKQPSNAAS